VTAAASGIGSVPGEDAVEAVRVVLGELGDPPGIVFVPELPARGATAGLAGRTAAVVSDLGLDLQPAGWRLTDAPGVDHRRARSLLAQDLDTLEEQTQGFTGTLKVQVAGPWTLASTVEKPRGDKVLSDVGARRDLAQALAEGVGVHLADVARRVPGARLVLQVDEPALPFVMDGRVPTASGFHRHRSVDAPAASEALEWVLGSAIGLGVETVVHCCAADVPVGLLRGAGADGVSLDVATIAPSAYDDLATLLDEGGRAWLGVVPSTGERVPEVRAATDRVRRLLDMLGWDADEVADRLVLTPACGMAGASPAYARGVLGVLVEAARGLG
jgi:methionine synthase II (cobalamin-independent)